MSVFLRAPYNYDADEVSYETGLVCGDKSLAQQHQAAEADINTIVRRFGVTGQLPLVSVPPTYDDFSGISDYQGALNLIRAAAESFAALPADVRYRFGNDASKYVDFCSDSANLEEMRKMGLAVPKEIPHVDSVSEDVGGPPAATAGGVG
ncbi:MAG: internal scaffolding protein [Microvirus sp.]|nr:MAG: internal scaffolding protein [Microvirus sp.]